MENRFRSSSKSNNVSLISLTDGRGRYYSLGHNDMINLNRGEVALGAAAAASSTLSNGLSMLANGRRIQQRYKLLTFGSVQICRVPHAKNIIEKIRFSRFLRRWEDHQIQLNSSEILSTSVCCRMIYCHVTRLEFVFVCFFSIERRLHGSTNFLFVNRRRQRLVEKQNDRF